MTMQQTSGQAAAKYLATGALSVRRDTGYGCLKATGEDALDLLNRLSTNRVDHLQSGHWAPTVLTSDRGRIVDLLTVIHAGEFVYLLTSAGQQQPVIEWLDKYTIMEDLEVEDVSSTTAVVALAGDGVRLRPWDWSRWTANACPVCSTRLPRSISAGTTPSPSASRWAAPPAAC